MKLDKDYVARLLGISKDELEKLIKEKIGSYFGFLDENTALVLILKDKGINVEDLLNVKVKNLSAGMKISNIVLYINKMLMKKENLIILECSDDTGKIRLIFKGNYKSIENILKEGNVIEVNGIVLKNRTLAIFVSNPKNIRLSNKKIEVKDLPYVTEFIGKVIDIKEDTYEILTERFNRIFAKSNLNLEKNKIYNFRAYLKKPIEIFYASEINNL